MKLQHEATTNSLDMGLVEKGKVRIKKKRDIHEYRKFHANSETFICIYIVLRWVRRGVGQGAKQQSVVVEKCICVSGIRQEVVRGMQNGACECCAWG
jgi:hypothetical protein